MTNWNNPALQRQKTTQDRFLEKVNKTDDCWEWCAAKFKSGYGMFYFEGSSKRAHRVSYIIFIGEIPPGVHVLHRCDNPSCVRPDHLYLGDAKKNAKDRVARGRSNTSYGEQHYCSKLTKHDVTDIRERYKKGESQSALGRRFGVTQQTVNGIVHGKLWRHV